MMFWIAAALLMGLTCLTLLSALGRESVQGAGHERAFYERQLAEIERQSALQLIGEREAETARIEAARRLLASERDGDRPSAASPLSRRLAAVFILVLIPSVALPLYLGSGMPDQPSMPLASRTPSLAGDAQVPNVTAAVEQIETHLARNPQDGRGHEVLGPVYLRLGRYGDAVAAFTAALRILGPTADRQANLAEAIIFQSEGVVTAEARTPLEAAATLDPRHVKARFFLALAAQQEGDKAKAVRLLTGLNEDLPAGEFKAEIGRQIAMLSGAPAAGEAIAALPAQDQRAAIRAMVEGLAERLATGGGSAAEWAQLIRALTVLKETDRVQAILAEARQKFAAEPEALKRIEDAGRASP